MRTFPVRFKVTLIFATLFAAGCTTALRNKQLERVAKDWALVIRASQVIPVYPLTEDLQPGDVLLVSTPLEEQVATYKDKGFLPLDQHLVRLYPKGYREFYNSRYGITDSDAGHLPPAPWQSLDAEGKHHWSLAPRAAFPTYQFSVDTGLGLNVAIPIQGVPFALGLMNSGKASGTVTIADAYTYGLDNVGLQREVNKWAKDTDNRRLLSRYQPQGGRTQFLRVLTRVYVTGRVSVTLKNDEATGAEAGAGADRPVSLVGIKEGASAENYKEAIGAINALAEKQLPGARFKIGTASSRSVTLTEAFARPLVIGYAGFDMPILEGGRLGAPISTLAQLTGALTPPPTPLEQGSPFRLAALSHLNAALVEDASPEAKTARADLDRLDRVLPKKYPFSLYKQPSPTAGTLERDSKVVAGSDVNAKGFRGVLEYLGNAQHTIETLEGHPNAKSNPVLSADLQAARDALLTTWNQIQGDPALARAVDYLFLGY